MTASANPVPPSNNRYISVEVLLPAIGTTKTRYVTSPVAGKIVHVASILDVAVDGDNVITAGIGATPAAVTGVSLKHLSGATAGNTLACKPTAANTVGRGDPISATTDGGGTTGQARVVFTIEQL